MNTKEKKIKYKFKEEEPMIVEESIMSYPALNLDLTKRYTYADYLTWIDGRMRELINGFVYVVGAPKRIHAQITMTISNIVFNTIRKRKGKCQIYHAPFAVRLPIEGSNDDDKIYDVVLPDICVVCDLSKLDDKGCIGAPDLIVEVLSPSTAQRDWNKKYNLYEKAGVREYWIVDPKAKVVYTFLLLPNGEYDLCAVYECNEKAPVHIFEGLEIDLKELFED